MKRAILKVFGQFMLFSRGNRSLSGHFSSIRSIDGGFLLSFFMLVPLTNCSFYSNWELFYFMGVDSREFILLEIMLVLRCSLGIKSNEYGCGDTYTSWIFPWRYISEMNRISWNWLLSPFLIKICLSYCFAINFTLHSSRNLFVMLFKWVLS